jgi:predicted neutral ceramidase superfamily lipid hydrolase
MTLSIDVGQQLLMLFLFLWSLLNLLYYMLVYKSRSNIYYALAFVMAIVYQIIFYVTILLDRTGIRSEPYVNYFTELSFKRNLLFAILAVIISLDMVLRTKRERSVLDEHS